MSPNATASTNVRPGTGGTLTCPESQAPEASRTSSSSSPSRLPRRANKSAFASDLEELIRLAQRCNALEGDRLWMERPDASEEEEAAEQQQAAAEAEAAAAATAQEGSSSVAATSAATTNNNSSSNNNTNNNSHNNESNKSRNCSPWQEVLKLGAVLALVEEPLVTDASSHQSTLETILDCLSSPSGALRFPWRMLKLLEKEDAKSFLGDLSRWPDVVAEASRRTSSTTEVRIVLVRERLLGVVRSWASECSLLRESGKAFIETVSSRAREAEKHLSDYLKASAAQLQIQEEQLEDCKAVANDLEAASSEFSAQLRQALETDLEWPDIWQLSRAAVSRIQLLSLDFLQNQDACFGSAMGTSKSHAAKAAASKAAALEARRQVQQATTNFQAASNRFLESAGQLSEWLRTLRPKLQSLSERRALLRTLLQLRAKAPRLCRAHLAAEDDLDATQTNLRKHRRHCAWAKSKRPSGAVRAYPQEAPPSEAEAVLEAAVKRAGERSARLERASNLLDQRLAEVEAEWDLPLEDEDEDEEEFQDRDDECLHLLDEDVGVATEASPRLQASQGGPQPSRVQRADDVEEEEISVSSKLAAAQGSGTGIPSVSIGAGSPREAGSTEAPSRRSRTALLRNLESDFMCPITHERMREPVLAADGHTYERQAIERWLQTHNTSPMTGANLTHRYLTENYALRLIIRSSEDEWSDDAQHYHLPSSPAGQREAVTSSVAPTASRCGRAWQASQPSLDDAVSDHDFEDVLDFDHPRIGVARARRR